jgi:Protein of unknown function (DUF559)
MGTVSAWRDAGISRSDLSRLVAAGDLVKIRYGVYATVAEVTAAAADPARAHALLVAGAIERVGGGVASHQSAAVLHGLSLLTKPPDGTVILTVPPGRRPGSYGRARVIRHSAELPGKQVTELFGLAVTTAGRTVVDIARTSSFMEGVVVADSAIHHLQTSKAGLAAVLSSCSGWPGIGRAREVADFASGLAESVFESCARVVFHEHGLPRPELQVLLSGGDGGVIARADFYWARYRVVGESDGLLKYEDSRAAIAELKRDRLLREAGFEVVHFTWQELFGQPERVIDRLRTAFARGSQHSADHRKLLEHAVDGGTVVLERRVM